MKKIAVIIPCYNEAEGIAQVIHSFPTQKLRGLGYDLEIIVVDNNSQDDTYAVAQAAGAHVMREMRQGKGHAIRKGFANIGDAEYVVMLDGDNTYRAEEIMRLIEPLESGFSDVVIGSRLHGRITDGSMKSLNHFGNRLYSRLVRHAYKVNVSDVLTGYFAWRREVILELLPHLKSPGFAIEMEMITKMARLGHSMVAVPITYYSRAGESSLRPFADGYRIMSMFFNNLNWHPQPVRPLPAPASNLTLTDSSKANF